jgi:hypothetical protein
MISIEDQIQPVTYDEAKQSIYEALAIVGVDATMWKPLGVYRTLVAAAAVMFSVTSVFLAKLASAGWYELATSTWLTLVARYVYGIYREDATFAQGALTFVNTGGAEYDNDPGEVVVSNPDTGAEYTNLTAFTIAGGTPEAPVTTSLDVDGNPILFRALEAGTGGTSGVGKIRGLVTTLLNVTVSNALSFVGLAEESDPSVRTRCKEQLAAQTLNGPEDAYARVARSVRRADGGSTGLNRVSVSKDGKGNVYVDVAQAGGQILGTVGDTSTDLGLINDTIQRTCAPLSVTARVRSQAGFSIAYTYELWMLDGSGLTPAQVEARVAANVAQKLAEVPLGGFVVDGEPGSIDLDWFRNLVEDAAPGVFRVDLTSPVTPTILIPPGRPPVAGTATSLGVHQVAQRIL